jgi:hypothetical protein
MNTIIRDILLVTPLLLTSLVHAEEPSTQKSTTPDWEISGSSNADVTINSYSGGSTITYFSLSTEIARPLSEVMQWNNTILWNTESGSAGYSSFRILLGVRANFGAAEFQNKFYVGADAGWSSVSYSTPDRKFNALAVQGELGKRIALSDSIAWAPQVQVYYRGESTVTVGFTKSTLSSLTSFSITPFRLTVMF